MTKRVCVVVTARPSYSRIRTALRAIRDDPDLELDLVLAGSAVLDRYGSMDEIVQTDGFEVAARVQMVIAGENLVSMAKTTGAGLMELPTVFDRLQPDCVVTIADRFETIATSIAAAYMNIPLVHIQGGERTGSIDDKVRHANTMLSDLHLVATDGAFDRVVGMGRAPETVHVTGCPSIDIAASVSHRDLDFDPYLLYGGVGAAPDLSDGYVVALQHPVTSEYGLSRAVALETLEALAEVKIPVLYFWPNMDAGSDGTAGAIRSFRERNDLPSFHFFKNMSPTDFLVLLLGAQALVGNSSVGIRECAYLGVPVVNVGSRQDNRERGRNVIDVDYRAGEILGALRTQLDRGRYTRDAVYGAGTSGTQIAEHIRDFVWG